jgi:hypothetical protein
VVGWLPPSPFIWNQRIGAAPGVLWQMPESLPYAFEGIEYVGLFQNQMLITLQAEQLTGIDVANGRQLWQLENGTEEGDIGNVYQAMIDNAFPIVYIANRSGQLRALSLLSNGSETNTPTLRPLWEVELDVFGQPNLLPLTDGGLLFGTRDHLFAIDAEGMVLWEAEDVSGPTAWTLTPDGILLSATGSEGYFGTADEAGLHLWENPGHDWPDNPTPVLAGERIWLYNRDGLYQLDLATQTAELRYTLPRGLTSLGDIVGLPDGGVLLAHADTADRRLLAFNGDGSLRWQRSYEGIVAGSVQLLEQNGRVYLTNIDNNRDTFSLYTVDLNSATLTQIFYGGSRSGNLGRTWLAAAGDRLIININGGSMLALDPAEVRP